MTVPTYTLPSSRRATPSHSALIVGVDEDIDLTPDEHEEIAAATKETCWQSQYDYQRALRANPPSNTRSHRQTTAKSRHRRQSLDSKKPQYPSYSIARRDLSIAETLRSIADTLPSNLTSSKCKEGLVIGSASTALTPPPFQYKSNYVQHCT